MSVKAVGIDLGTTYSVVACLDEDGKPRTIPSAEGDLTTPSVVLFDEGAVVVGKEAARAAVVEADRIADFAKRDMGRSEYVRKIRGQAYRPEVIQSFVLEKLKRDAELVIGPFSKAVVTVPAFFNEPRRKATQDAGRLAGIEVLDIINEPTAAALVYGIEHGFLDEAGEASRTERILVYDLGGGTFDVTLMEVSGARFRTIATAGDVLLGGIDWDRRIVDHIAKAFREKHRGLDPTTDPRALQRLRREAEEAKRALSVREQITISFECAGEGLRIPLTRSEFVAMTDDLLERTIFTTKSLVQGAGLEWKEITRVLLVGGSTRMPAVASRLRELTRRDVDRSLSPDEAVAQGAAIYAGFLLTRGAGQSPRLSVTNVNSHSLGILATDAVTRMRRNVTLIPRNTPLPAAQSRRFKTGRESQRSVVVKVIEGEDPTGRNASLIGTCEVDNLPPGLPSGTIVDVSFRYAESGRLTVAAEIPSIGRKSAVELDRSAAGGMTEEEIRTWSTRRPASS